MVNLTSYVVKCVKIVAIKRKTRAYMSLVYCFFFFNRVLRARGFVRGERAPCHRGGTCGRRNFWLVFVLLVERCPPDNIVERGEMDDEGLFKGMDRSCRVSIRAPAWCLGQRLSLMMSGMSRRSATSAWKVAGKGETWLSCVRVLAP